MRSLRASWLVRCLLLLLAATLVAEQGAMHVCPMHTGAHVTATGDHAPAGDNVPPASHDAHGAHDSAKSAGIQVVATTPPDHAPAPPAHTECNCLGQCASAASVSLHATAESFVPVPAILARAAHVPSQQAAPRQPTADHRLPFANAPPRAA